MSVVCKRKTEYEVSECDRSSGVCSSDLSNELKDSIISSLNNLITEEDIQTNVISSNLTLNLIYSYSAKSANHMILDILNNNTIDNIIII